MYKLSDCSVFKASVEEVNGLFFVVVVGLGRDSVYDILNQFEVQKKKEFSSRKACMDFFNVCACSDYVFDEEDFLFVSDRYVPIDYFSCGVDFDEE